jgi:RNA polymerase sigma-B factor
MTGKASNKVSQPIQSLQASDDEAEGILAVPEDLENRFPELKRRYLEYRRQKGFPDLSVEDVVGKLGDLELLQAYRAKPSVAVRNRLVQQNIGLVRKVAHQVSRHCAEPYDDLVQVGSMGLIRAIERFDIGRGYSFSSFAVPYIRGEMQHYLRDRSSSVRIPRRFRELELAHKGRRISQELGEDLGRLPTECEVADALGISAEEWYNVRVSEVKRMLLSLDDAVSAQDDATFSLGDILPDFKYHSFQLAEEDRLRLRQALHELESPTRDILDFVFFQGLTQAETARRMGMSPMTVSRKIKSGLRQLWYVLDVPT